MYKKLRKYIREVLKENIINEFITQDEVALKSYFSMTDEQIKKYIPHEYYYFFNDFLDEEQIDFEIPTNDYTDADGDQKGEELQDYDLINWIENNNKEIYNQFSEYLFKKINNNELPLSDAEYPAWSYFDRNPTLIKNQWLIHFTNDAESISVDGFKYGVNEIDKLGLTTSLGEFEKKYGGYNFAYLLKDFMKYGRRGYTSGGGFKYGKEAVIFKASGIQLWHHGDEEPQVIFYGNTAQNIIPITSGENANWAIRSEKSGNILFENDDLEKVVDWLVKNYDQYRKQLR